MRSFDDVVKQVRAERNRQVDKWGAGSVEGRSFEEWLLLADVYMHEAMSAFAHNEGNGAAMPSLAKVANLVIGALQAGDA